HCRRLRTAIRVASSVGKTGGQRHDVVDREAGRQQITNRTYLLYRRAAELAIAIVQSRRLQQPRPFVVANRARAGARPLCDLSDAHSLPSALTPCSQGRVINLNLDASDKVKGRDSVRAYG